MRDPGIPDVVIPYARSINDKIARFDEYVSLQQLNVGPARVFCGLWVNALIIIESVNHTGRAPTTGESYPSEQIVRDWQ